VAIFAFNGRESGIDAISCGFADVGDEIDEIFR
jgi:hypothetical protein